MPARLRLADPGALVTALARLRSGSAGPAELRLLTKHSLALLSARAPGAAVEVRVPPYAVVQAVPGTRHTRGTPPAVVETDPETWVALAVGDLDWHGADAQARLRASGERSDLSRYLPLITTPEATGGPSGEPSGEPSTDPGTDPGSGASSRS